MQPNFLFLLTKRPNIAHFALREISVSLKDVFLKYKDWI
jgi:hypothetical protein